MNDVNGSEFFETEFFEKYAHLYSRPEVVWLSRFIEPRVGPAENAQSVLDAGYVRLRRIAPYLVMPKHKMPDYPLSDCSADRIVGYVHIIDSAHWHCNRCGAVVDIPEEK